MTDGTGAIGGGDDEGALFAWLSQHLRDAHRRVAALDVDDDRKAAATRNLIAITNASKHDLRRAAERLRRFEAALDAGKPPSEVDD